MFPSIKKIAFFLPVFGLFLSLGSGISYAVVEYDELVKFAKQLEISISSRNPYYFNLCFNTDAIIREVVNQEDTAAYNAFTQGFIEGIKKEFDLGAVIIDEIDIEGSFDFIRAYQQNNKSKILFRLISDYGINYHEYEVELHNGELMIADGYIFTAGQSISSTFEQIYTDYLLNIYRITEGRPNKDVGKKIEQLAVSGKIKKAYKKWVKLPDYIRYSKSNQLLGIALAKELGKKEYFGTYIEFTHHFPNEPGKYFIPLDGLIEHGYYKAALKDIEKLDEIIQYDPLLNIFRADIYYELKDVVKAESSLNRLIESMPDYETGYINLLGLYLEEKEFAKATELLDKIILTFNTSKEDLLPFFVNHSEFINSTEFKNWLDH